MFCAFRHTHRSFIKLTWFGGKNIYTFVTYSSIKSSGGKKQNVCKKKSTQIKLSLSIKKLKQFKVKLYLAFMTEKVSQHVSPLCFITENFTEIKVERIL